METDLRCEALKLDNQLCFPLYACAKEIVRRYKPLLDEIDLTYTQYLVMMVLWEHRSLCEKEIGQKLRLDSGTLTPVTKKLAEKGFLTRTRCPDDERNLMLSLSPEGEALRQRALTVPYRIGACVPLSPEKARQLYDLLYEVLDGMADGR